MEKPLTKQDTWKALKEPVNKGCWNCSNSLDGQSTMGETCSRCKDAWFDTPEGDYSSPKHWKWNGVKDL